MHHLGQRSADAAVARRLASTAERLILVAGLLSFVVLVFAAFG